MKEDPRKQKSHEKEKEGRKNIPCLSLLQPSDPDTCNPNLQNILDEAEHYIQAVSWDGGCLIGYRFTQWRPRKNWELDASCISKHGKTLVKHSLKKQNKTVLLPPISLNIDSYKQIERDKRHILRDKRHRRRQ